MAKPSNTLKIPMDRIMSLLSAEHIQYPKYTSQIINLANQNAQGTRPNKVGQMSELIQECPSNDYEQWCNWYRERYPEALDVAKDSISKMVENFKEAITQIDDDLIKAWVEDLVLTKTFVGLKVQQGILKAIAEEQGTTCRLAGPHEESQGIDGYIGDIPVSIKPTSYKTKDMLNEVIDVPIIFYEKGKDGFKVDYGNLPLE